MPEVMFDPTFFGRIGEIDLANFIASNILFEATFSYGYLKPVFRRSSWPSISCATTRTCASARTISSSPRRWPAAPNAWSSRPRGTTTSSARARFRGCLSCVTSRRCWPPTAPLCRDHELDAAARTAQARRTRSLEQAASFLMLVDHIKAGAPLKAVAAALRDPAALRHLRMPIAARLRRLAPLRTGS